MAAVVVIVAEPETSPGALAVIVVVPFLRPDVNPVYVKLLPCEMATVFGTVPTTELDEERLTPTPPVGALAGLPNRS